MVLVPHGIRMPEGKIVESESLYEGDPLPRPYVLKPVNEGSSVGVAIVTEGGNYGDPIGRDVEGPWQHFEQLLAEPFIKGRELTVAVLDDEALAVTELQPKSGFYDYDAKYTDGMTEHVCPADMPDEIAEAMLAMALKAHRLLGCKGASRSDFRWDDEQGEDGLYLLEVNTQPGMTPLSLVPEQARARGIDYADAGRADRGGGVMTARIARGAPAAAGRPRGAGAAAARHRAQGQAEAADAARIARLLAGLRAAAGQLAARRDDRRGGDRRRARLPPAAARRHRHRRGRSARPASPSAGSRSKGLHRLDPMRGLRISPSTASAASPCRWSTCAAFAQRLLAARLGRGGAGLAPPARHARHRHRRARAGRDLAA